MKTNKLKKIQRRVQKTHKAINLFINQTLKNYESMKTKIIKIWACLALAIIVTSCNVTRSITNESQYFQKGDTSVVIQTKTIETYDATKKL